MTDIVERLRKPKPGSCFGTMGKAADEIGRLTAVVEQRQALIGHQSVEIERLRAAHQEIIDLENNKIVSGEGLFMRALLIARRALK